MSIASELNNYRSGLEDAYDAVSDMSGTIPTDRNMNNLDDAIRTIPISSPNDGVLTITQNGTTIQTFSANQATNVTAALTDTTYSTMTGASSGAAGTSGLVPAPAVGDQAKVLHGDGTWKDTTAKLVEMSYGESNAWAKFIAAYNAGSIVYCRASSNSNPASGSQTRKAFMAYVNNATSPTSVEFQYVRSVSSKTDSQQGDQVFVYTLTNASGGTWSVASRNIGPKINVSGPITKTFTTGANATITLGADAMTGATSSADGAAGIVPKPSAGDEAKVLSGAGTWVAQPTVNDATFTIQKNGTDVATFTANQSTNATANITVPTSFSDLSGTGDVVQKTSVIWGPSITFDLAVGHHAIVMMMGAWAAFLIHHGAGWQLLTFFNGGVTVPTYTTSGNTITITSADSSDQTWTAFK